jgi:hypothetical protein
VKKRTKKQHYVPQYLLRHFATGTRKNAKVWVLDKSSKTVRLASIRDIAHENAFYEFHDPDGTHVEMEHLLEKLDDIGARLSSEIIQTGRLQLSVKDRVWLSYVVACQMCRTPTIRKDMDHIRQRIIDKWGPNVRAEGDSRTVGECSPADSTFGSLMVIREDVPSFAKILQTKTWFLADAPKGCSFIISDNPVTRHNMIKRPGRGNLGLNNRGIEIYFPVSPRYSLHIVCPLLVDVVCSTNLLNKEYVRGIKDGMPVRMLPENVTFANSHQVIWAERWIFGQNRADMDLPLDMLRTNPELMDGPGVRQKG